MLDNDNDTPDLEADLKRSPKILQKVKDDGYAQRLYHSLCNTDWIRNEFYPLLRQDPDRDFWGCSWRYAGGIVADLRNDIPESGWGGDYLDWYCSGREGWIDEEVAADLLELGWVGRDSEGKWIR